MNDIVKGIVLNATGAYDAEDLEIVQELWSGYGKIIRIQLYGGKVHSIILKKITSSAISTHPRGWDTDNSHQRKIKSYQVEMNWYKEWSKRCNEHCRVPYAYSSITIENELIIVLEDLDAAGYSLRRSVLNLNEVKLCVEWLINFHATFIGEDPTGLWPIGTYWHLATRPDEYKKMENGALKENAYQIDSILNNCKYKTILHGDAKVANFCFSEDMKAVAAVDFQYVGGGCGIKDLVYLLGSCLTEEECELWEEEILTYYFGRLHEVIQFKRKEIDFNALEQEWRNMYPVAIADFNRFLMGWMPSHQKMNNYTIRMEERVIKNLREKNN